MTPELLFTMLNMIALVSWILMAALPPDAGRSRS